MQGQTIRQFDARSGIGSFEHLFWDGTNSFGKQAEPGIYLCIVRNAKTHYSAHLIKL
jgi:hypothetical protein